MKKRDLIFSVILFLAVGAVCFGFQNYRSSKATDIPAFTQGKAEVSDDDLSIDVDDADNSIIYETQEQNDADLTIPTMDAADGEEMPSEDELKLKIKGIPDDVKSHIDDYDRFEKSLKDYLYSYGYLESADTATCDGSILKIYDEEHLRFVLNNEEQTRLDVEISYDKYPVELIE